MTSPSTHKDYEFHPYSPWRAIMSDALRVAKEKNYIFGLYEIDVTDARRRIHAYKTRTGDDFSFTAFLLGCIGRAVEENKSVQALRQGKRLIVFDDVDVNVQVEHEVDGKKIVSAYVVRAANRKTARQIHDEIRAAQHEKVASENPVALSRSMMLAMRLPSFLRRMLLRRVLNDPFMIRRLSGTVDVTAIGMFGNGGGWGIPISETSLDIAIGGIEQTVKCIDGQFCVREMLSITLCLDHDVIDGAPAVRFAGCLKSLVESGYGLDALDA